MMYISRVVHLPLAARTSCSAPPGACDEDIFFSRPFHSFVHAHVPLYPHCLYRYHTISSIIIYPPYYKERFSKQLGLGPGAGLGLLSSVLLRLCVFFAPTRQYCFAFQRNQDSDSGLESILKRSSALWYSHGSLAHESKIINATIQCTMCVIF